MTEPDNCQRCGKPILNVQSVTEIDRGETTRLCSECCSELMSEEKGANSEHREFAPLSIEDCDGTPHFFEFETRYFHERVRVEAREIRDGVVAGYRFAAAGDLDCDLMKIFETLYTHMRRELSRKYLEETDYGWQITDSAEVRGAITFDDETEGLTPRLVIDGEDVSWAELGRMLMNYEGFHFRLEIYDATDEPD